MSHTKKYMKMPDVHRLVSRWFAERVELKDGATLKTTVGCEDFLNWLRHQSDRGNVAGYQWARSMKQKKFTLGHVGRDHLFFGIKLKPPPEMRHVKNVDPERLLRDGWKRT